MSGRRRLVRWIVAGIAGLLLVACLVIVGVGLLLRSAGGKRALVERASSWSQTNLGFSIAVEDLTVRPLGGRLELHDLALTVEESRPFAVVGRVSAAWRPTSILSRRLRVYELTIEAPRLDLAAPLPEAAGQRDEEAETELSLPLAIDRIVVTGGSVSGPAPAALTELLEAWRVDDLEIDAGLDGSRFGLRELAATVIVEPKRRPRLTWDLAAAAAGELGGEVEVSRFRAAGDGLTVELAGVLAPDLERSRASVRLTADAGFWLEQQTTPPLRIEGDFDLASWSGSLGLRAADQPGRLLAPFVEAELAEALELETSAVDLAVDLGLASERRIAGEMALDLRRGTRPIAELRVSPDAAVGEMPTGIEDVSVDVDVRLLPGEEGARRIRGLVRVDDPGEPAGWWIETGETTVEAPHLERLLATVAGLYPRLVPSEPISGLPPLGRLAVRGDFSGAALDPEVDVDIDWRPHRGARVEATVAGRPVGGSVEVKTAASGLELAELTGGVGGRLAWSGTLRGRPVDLAGKLELTAEDLVAGDAQLFERLALTISGDRREVGWRLAGRSASLGGFDGQGELTPETPLRIAGGELEWTTGDERIPFVSAAFRVADGRLGVAARAPTIASVEGGDGGELELDLPLAELAALPQLEALAKLPLERAEGPVVVDWRLRAGDWRELLPAGVAARVSRFETSSTGRLELDLGCIACSTGRAAVADVGLELDGRVLTAPETLALTLDDGRLEIAPWRLAGEGATIAIEGGAVLARDWLPADAPASLVESIRAALRVQLDAAWLEAAGFEGEAAGSVSVSADLAGPLSELTGSAILKAPDLRLSAAAFPTLELSEPSARLTLSSGELAWRDVRLGIGDGELTSAGTVRLAEPLASTEGWLVLEPELPAVERLRLPFVIVGGVLRIDDGEVETEGGRGELRLEVPIDGRRDGTIRASWDLPATDWAPLLVRLSGGEDPQELVASVRGNLEVDPAQPALAVAHLELSRARVVVRGRETVVEPALTARLADARLQVAPTELRSGTESFLLEAEADLEAGWTPGDALADLLARFRLRGAGALDAGLLNPVLGGGRAEGWLELDLAADGVPGAATGRIEVRGPAASILYRSPYLVRLEQPELTLVLADGRMVVEAGSARLNEGTLSLSGVASDAGAADLSIGFSDALFRLDYGLLATIGGDLTYRLTSEGASTVAGTITVDRGALTRDVELDLDLLSQLLAPIDLTTTEEDPLELVELDLAVRTREGVRVKNNLGDLLVRWEPIAVSGSVARPVLEGKLEVDPGGLLYAYGQTVRLDRAVIDYPGQEGAEPRLDFEATTSIEDPTIGRLEGDDPFRSMATEEEGAEVTAPGAVTAGLARFYGEEFAGRLGESVGAKISLRPLLIFGEADPGARLTVSRDFSPTFSVAASIDLRSAESQTYLLEAHELRRLPGLVGQAFTDDESAYGGALLQRQEFGGSRRLAGRDLPRIGKIAARPPERVSKRGLKRALGLEKGDPFDATARFASEVEIIDYLQRKGYPDARVKVRDTPLGRHGRKVRLDVEIEPGPHVVFDFVGEKIPKPLRGLIRSLYRADFFEPESIEEMRTETVRSLRSQGFLDPAVTVTVEPIDAGDPDGDRRVSISTEGGQRISPQAPVFVGLPAEDAAALGAVFTSVVQRVELAVGLASADRRLLRALADLGYSEARIVNRYQTLDTQALTVEIDPGPRLQVADISVELVGETGGIGLTAEDLVPLLGVRQGDALRRDRLARSVVSIERELGERGFLDARARAVIGEEPGGGATALPVRFVVEPGTTYTLEAVEFTGMRSTREQWARGVTGLDTGAVLARDDLARARTSLWRTGLFSGVSAETSEVGPGRRRVVFDLAEHDRYQIAYGVRWDSEDGMSAVFDATDSNFLGRSWTLGLRALYSDNDKSLRWLTRVPRPFGGRGSLEFFALSRELIDRGIVSDILEGTLQYSLPIGEHATLRSYGRYRDTRLTEEDPNPFLPLDERIKSPLLGWQYLYDSRGPEAFVDRGLFASVDLSGSDDFLGSDFRYVRVFAQANLYRPIGRLLGRRISWAQSYRVGLARAFDQELLREVRFFAGGEYSVRGYGTESLGPEERLGSIVRPVGGEALLVVNQEFRWRLFGDYQLLAFFDAGNVWDDSAEFGSDLFTSAGLGIRAATPVGLLRLDVAHPLDQREEVDPNFKIYFGLGNTF